MKTPGDPRNNYLARMDWVDDGTLAIQQLNRLQNTNDVLSPTPRPASVRPVFRDRSKAWVETMDEVALARQADRVRLGLSEQDGWRHAYRGCARGGDERLADEVRRRHPRRRRRWTTAADGCISRRRPRERHAAVPYASRLDGADDPSG